MDLGSLRTRLFSMLPFFLILMLLFGIAVFGVRDVLPNYQEYATVADNVTAQHDMIGTLAASQGDSDNQVILQHQINNVESTLQSVGAIFLSDSEAEQVLNRLYSYAYAKGVRIINLQAQAASATATAPAPYRTTVYQVQMSGGISNFIDFISHFREASLPGVSIVNINIARAQTDSVLTMSLLIYTSPYASGSALTQLPTVEAITPTATPSPTLSPSPTATTRRSNVTPQAQPSPTSTLTPTLIPTATFTPTATLSPTPLETAVTCTGAEPTMFKVGDIAIVHFNELGALRVLADPNGPIMSTRTQAYDNQRLEIVAGPVCANSSFYWYIRNLSHDDDLGWVAEGKGGERWLCPEADPECTNS